MEPIVFRLVGSFPSKKNNKQIIQRKIGGGGSRPTIISSARYLKSVGPTEKQFRTQMDAIFGKDVEPRLTSVAIDMFMMYQTRRVCDSHNIAEGLFDIMQSVGLIHNDDHKVIKNQSIVSIHNPDIEEDKEIYIRISDPKQYDLLTWSLRGID